jgi:hypothetical protein
LTSFAIFFSLGFFIACFIARYYSKKHA